MAAPAEPGPDSKDPELLAIISTPYAGAFIISTC